MRPSDLFWWLSAPAGPTALFLREEWLPAVLAGAVLGFFALFVRPLLRAYIEDVKEYGGFWAWVRGGVKTAKEVEEFRDARTEHVAGRRMRRLEARQERREFKRDVAAREEQLKLFPW